MKDESASTQHSQAETVSEQQPEDTPITEQQQESESIPEQQKQHASETLTSLSSEDSHSPLPDYSAQLRSFTTKDPSSIPKKPRYSLHPKPN